MLALVYIAICIISCIVLHIYRYDKYNAYTERLYNSIKSIKMYYFSSNKTYLEYIAYKRYKSKHHDTWRGTPDCNIMYPFAANIPCYCMPQKLLQCGCRICPIRLRRGGGRLPTLYYNFGIDYLKCDHCHQPFTPNLVWNYNPNRGEQLRKSIVNVYVLNFENNMDMTIPSGINGIIQKFYESKTHDIKMNPCIHCVELYCED